MISDFTAFAAHKVAHKFKLPLILIAPTLLYPMWPMIYDNFLVKYSFSFAGFVYAIRQIHFDIIINLSIIDF